MTKNSIFTRLLQTDELAKIQAQSNTHIRNIQKTSRKGSGRKKPELNPLLEKYYSDSGDSDVVQISKELKKALNFRKIETGKPVKLMVTEAIIQYLELN
jgi:hypothetical protein